MDSLFEKFNSLKVLVIGDVMIDAYLTGKVARISPEAPVPIVEINNRTYRIGGAANVAMNVKALGATPILCSVVGNDEKSELFSELLRENNLYEDGICKSNKRKTTVKYRIVGNNSQMLRIDDEVTCELDEADEAMLCARIEAVLRSENIGAIIFEDYDKGVLTKKVIDFTVALAKRNNIIVTVDPKKRNFNSYAGVDLFKPNLKELQEGLDNRNSSLAVDEIGKLMKGFAEKMGIAKMMTTLSERGIAVYDSATQRFFSQPAFLRHISDVSGAGDTVIAVATLCLATGVPTDKMMVIANLAGGIVCEYAGVVPIDADTLKKHAKKELDNFILN